MKAKNNNGFVFIETIVVISLLIVSMLLIYGAFNNLSKLESERKSYNNTEYLYRTYYYKNLIATTSYYQIRQIVNVDGYYEISCDSTELNGTLCSYLTNSFDIESAYIVSSDLDYVIDNAILPADFNDFLVYVKSSARESEDGLYRILVKYNNGEFATIELGNLVYDTSSNTFSYIFKRSITVTTDCNKNGGYYLTSKYFNYGYFCGNIEDNYVYYQGRLWRIMGYDETGVELISDDIITSQEAGDAYYQNSDIKTYLETSFYPTLYSTDILTQKFFKYNNTATTVLYKEVEESSASPSNAGTLSAYEYKRSLGKTYGELSTYLDINQAFWTSTKYSDTNVWTINSLGSLTNLPYNRSLGVRAVLYLSPDASFLACSEGECNGEINTPYLLANDEYFISFDLDNGITTQLLPTVLAIKTKLTLTPPTRKGYTFSGWTVESGTNTTVIGSQLVMGKTASEIKANWTKNTYTLGINPNGGTWCTATNSCSTAARTFNQYYEDIVDVKDPTYSNICKVFDYWELTDTNNDHSMNTSTKKYTMGYSNQTLKAIWNDSGSHNYTIKLNGGTYNNSTNDITGTLACNSGKSIYPTKECYRFQNYSITSGTNARVSGSTIYMGTSDAVFTANWTDKNNWNFYCYNSANQWQWSGSSILLSICNPVLPSTVSIPPSSGYTFGGWYTGQNNTGTKIYNNTGTKVNNTIPTSTILYGVCTPKNYTITLDRRGGTGGSTSATATYGQALPSISIPTKSGYQFQGYYTQTGCQGTQYYNSSGQYVRYWYETNKTLYACYQGYVKLTSTNCNSNYSNSNTAYRTYEGYNNGYSVWLADGYNKIIATASGTGCSTSGNTYAYIEANSGMSCSYTCAESFGSKNPYRGQYVYYPSSYAGTIINTWRIWNNSGGVIQLISDQISPYKFASDGSTQDKIVTAARGYCNSMAIARDCTSWSDYGARAMSTNDFCTFKNIGDTDYYNYYTLAALTPISGFSECTTPDVNFWIGSNNYVQYQGYYLYGGNRCCVYDGMNSYPRYNYSIIREYSSNAIWRRYYTTEANHGLRPIIAIKSNTLVSGGNGTQSSPYVLVAGP